MVLLAWMISASAALSAEQSVILQGDRYLAIGQSDLEQRGKAEAEACDRARRNLVAYLFGASYQVNQRSLRAEDEMRYSEDMVMNSRKVVLRGIVTSFEGGKCTIQYPLVEAELEKARISGSDSSLSLPLSEFGTEGATKGGILEIISYPEDIDVYIDNVRWGRTPLRFNGKFDIGEHLVRLEHPSYEIEEERVQIGRESIVRIERKMRTAKSSLTVHSKPAGARILINGRTLGETPLGPITFDAGENLSVTAEYEESDTVTQSFTLSRNERKVLEIQMPLKLGLVRLPELANEEELLIDGKKPEQVSVERGKNTIKIPVGDHTIHFKRKGKLSFPIPIKVRSEASQSIRHPQDGDFPEDQANFHALALGDNQVGFGFGYPFGQAPTALAESISTKNETHYSFQVHYCRRLFADLALRLGYEYQTYQSSDLDPNNRIVGAEIAAYGNRKLLNAYESHRGSIAAVYFPVPYLHFGGGIGTAWTDVQAVKAGLNSEAEGIWVEAGKFKTYETFRVWEFGLQSRQMMGDSTRQKEGGLYLRFVREYFPRLGGGDPIAHSILYGGVVFGF